MSTKTLEQLEQELTDARKAADEAEKQAQARREAEEAKRQKRLQQHDRQRLAAYDDAAFEAEQRAAEQRLREAILADPVYAAAIDLNTAMLRRVYAHSTASGDASRLGVPFNATSPPAGDFSLPDHVTRTIEREASRRARDEQDAVDQARITAGEGA